MERQIVHGVRRGQKEQLLRGDGLWRLLDRPPGDTPGSTRHQVTSARLELQSPHLAARCIEPANFLSCGRVPEPDAADVVAAGQDRTVRTEHDAFDHGRVPLASMEK